MTSRSTKSLKKVQAAKEIPKSASQSFKLPGSMSLSDICFPVMLKPNIRHANWKEITAEHDYRVKELLKNADREEVPSLSQKRFENKETDYIQNEVFGLLIPALEDTLERAKMWNAFEDHQCLFNGVDHIAQYLWNHNPRYPQRKVKNLYIFDMPWVQKQLERRRRPLYPKSWIWTEDYAAIMIQRTYRKYLAQQDPEIRELRQFWKKLAAEEQLTDDISANPILLKKFASSAHIIKTISTKDNRTEDKNDI